MRIIPPSFEVLAMPEGGEALRLIEAAGRTCYKSEPKNNCTLHEDDPRLDACPGFDSDIRRCSPACEHHESRGFVRRIIDSSHHSVIEHCSATVRLVCDRGVTHELVRHRLASFSQESTRYCNYAKGKFGGEITVIRPYFWREDEPAYAVWREAMAAAETAYLRLLALGAKAQEARSVLPNSLKTEIVITANVREWRHIFALRTAQAAHPQMREIMLPLLTEFQRRIPIVFDDIGDAQ